jgi:O-antigen ligase
LQLLAIFLTFSRSGWLGAALALVLVFGWQYRESVLRIVRRFWIAGAVVLLLGTTVAFTQRNTPFVQGYISHTSNDGDLSSNDYHWLFIKQGLEGIVDRPLGHGPGTAGLASIQNPHGSFLTENYYIQIGYEVGILGLAIFIAINSLLYVLLWQRRTELWPAVLLATFWSYVLINMLLHIWSNEAVACQWWLLAGLVLGMPSKTPKET